MNSILREKYSISSCFYLFCFLFFLTKTGKGQEILWSDPGIGALPSLRLAVREDGNHQIFIFSPFSNQIKTVRLDNGQEAWRRTFPERVPYSPLPLTESLVVQGDQGTIWALSGDTGYILWESRASQPTDFPIAPPRFRDGSIFTLSKNGQLQKFDSLGRPGKPARHPNSWGDRKAQTVPLRSYHSTLTFLDQSGRLVSYDPTNLTQTVQDLWSKGGALSRIYGQSREALAGAITPDRGVLYVSELPGFLRAYSMETSKNLWTRSLGSTSNLYSDAGEILAAPTILRSDTLSAVITTNRTDLTVWSQTDGRPLKKLRLPSEAALAPLYDARAKRWWVLCERHLVSLDLALESLQFELPIVDTPHSLAVKDTLAVVGTTEGRIYGLKLPLSPQAEAEKAQQNPSRPPLSGQETSQTMER